MLAAQKVLPRPLWTRSSLRVCVATLLPLLRSSIIFPFHPRLAPWAAFLRRFAANLQDTIPLSRGNFGCDTGSKALFIHGTYSTVKPYPDTNPKFFSMLFSACCARRQPTSYRILSMNVTLLISFSVVRPILTLSRADSRRNRIPSSRAARRISEVGFLARIISRMRSLRSSTS
jgi:hypothetical protein